MLDTNHYEQGYKQNDKQQTEQNINDLSSTQIRNYVNDAGVVGLGGALFPTGAKLHSAEKTDIDLLIINAAECEPLL